MMLAAHIKLLAFRLAFRNASELKLPRYLTCIGEEVAAVCAAKGAKLADDIYLLTLDFYESLPKHSCDHDSETAINDLEDLVWEAFEIYDEYNFLAKDRTKLRPKLESWFDISDDNGNIDESFDRFRSAMTQVIIANTIPPKDSCRNELLDPSAPDLRKP